MKKKKFLSQKLNERWGQLCELGPYLLLAVFLVLAFGPEEGIYVLIDNIVEIMIDIINGK